MPLSFSRRKAARAGKRKSRRPATKRRRLIFDSLEARQLLSGGTLVASGSQFEVNPLGTTAQLSPPAQESMDSRGDAVVAWSQPQGNGTWNLMFQRYTDSAGTLTPATTGPVTQASNVVGAFNGSDAPRVEVAMAPDGELVVAWETNNVKHLGSGGFTDNYTTHVQLYNANGTANGNPLVVGGTNNNSLMSVAMNNSGFDVVYGEFVAGKHGTSWWETTVQRYTSSGSTVGSPISVAQAYAEHSHGAIAMDATSDFVAMWNPQGGSSYGSFVAEPFSSAGRPLANAFAVNGATGSVAMDPTTGEFVIPWEQALPAPGPGATDAADLYASQYHLDGTLLQTVTVATAAPYSSIVGTNGTTYYYEATASPSSQGFSVGVAALPGGAFDVSWTSDYVTLSPDPNTQSGYYGTHHDNVNVSTINADGTANQTFAVTTDDTSTGSAAAVDGNNDLLVIWADSGNIDGQFYLDPPATTSPTVASPPVTASPAGSSTAATDAVFAAYAYPDDDDTLG